MNQIKLNIAVTFTEPLLATASGNPEIHEEFIASKSGDSAKAAEELETLPVADQIEKASTVFHRDDTGLFIYDYCWRGFLKEAIQAMIELGEVKKLNPWNFRKAVDGAIFVTPRRIYLYRPVAQEVGKSGIDGVISTPDGNLQHPVRAQTLRGERIALSRSELVSPGATQSFQVTILQSANQKSAWAELTPDLVRACFDMGTLKGLGQWRSGGYGRFTAIIKPE